MNSEGLPVLTDALRLGGGRALLTLEGGQQVTVEADSRPCVAGRKPFLLCINWTAPYLPGEGFTCGVPPELLGRVMYATGIRLKDAPALQQVDVQAQEVHFTAVDAYGKAFPLSVKRPYWTRLEIPTPLAEGVLGLEVYAADPDTATGPLASWRFEVYPTGAGLDCLAALGVLERVQAALDAEQTALEVSLESIEDGEEEDSTTHRAPDVRGGSR